MRLFFYFLHFYKTVFTLKKFKFWYFYYRSLEQNRLEESRGGSGYNNGGDDGQYRPGFGDGGAFRPGGGSFNPQTGYNY